MDRRNELDDSSHSFRELFLIHICQFQFVMYIGLVYVMMLLLLAIASLLFGALDEGTRVVLLINFLLLGIALTVILIGLYLCRRQ